MMSSGFGSYRYIPPGGPRAHKPLAATQTSPHRRSPNGGVSGPARSRRRRLFHSCVRRTTFRASNAAPTRDVAAQCDAPTSSLTPLTTDPLSGQRTAHAIRRRSSPPTSRARPDVLPRRVEGNVGATVYLAPVVVRFDGWP